MDRPRSRRRARPRARVTLAAQYTVAGATGHLEGTLRDLSIDGAMLEVAAPLAADTLVALTFRTSLLARRVRVDATVVGSSRGVDRPLLHLRFAQPLGELGGYVADAVLDEIASAQGPLLATPTPERRDEDAAPRAPRLWVAIPVTCRVESEAGAAPIPAVILSLAERGARLRALSPIEEGRRVGFSFRPGLLRGKVAVAGTVRWCRPREETHEVGIAFDAAVPAIARLVEEASRPREPVEAAPSALALLLWRQGIDEVDGRRRPDDEVF
jgi:hypothetical protein